MKSIMALVALSCVCIAAPVTAANQCGGEVTAEKLAQGCYSRAGSTRTLLTYAPQGVIEVACYFNGDGSSVSEEVPEFTASKGSLLLATPSGRVAVGTIEPNGKVRPINATMLGNRDFFFNSADGKIYVVRPGVMLEDRGWATFRSLGEVPIFTARNQRAPGYRLERASYLGTTHLFLLHDVAGRRMLPLASATGKGSLAVGVPLSGVTFTTAADGTKGLLVTSGTADWLDCPAAAPSSQAIDLPATASLSLSRTSN